MLEGQKLNLIGFAIERFESQRSPVKRSPSRPSKPPPWTGRLLQWVCEVPRVARVFSSLLESSAVSKCRSRSTVALGFSASSKAASTESIPASDASEAWNIDASKYRNSWKMLKNCPEMSWDVQRYKTCQVTASVFLRTLLKGLRWLQQCDVNINVNRRKPLRRGLHRLQGSGSTRTRGFGGFGDQESRHSFQRRWCGRLRPATTWALALSGSRNGLRV